MTFRDKHITSDIPHRMQPQYLGEISKTSRTMANEDEDVATATKKAVSAVLRKPHKVHKRNKKRRIPYFLKKHKLGQRVSFNLTNHLHFPTEDYSKTMEQTHGSPAFGCYQDPRRYPQVSVQQTEDDRDVDSLLSKQASAATTQATASSDLHLCS